MKEIPITNIENIRIGNAQDSEGATGCTVLLCEKGASAGLDVRGGGPASRESELLKPVAACEAIHAILLSGGSAFGLHAAGGVMQYLEEKGIGFDTGFARVPLVCASCLYDLGVGSPSARPTPEMAYQACLDAEKNQPAFGNAGAGTGASVGKLLGMEYAMKSGLGAYAVEVGPLQVGALVAVNALGDIFSPEGRRIAGLLNPKKDGMRGSLESMYTMLERPANLFAGNTTLGVILTNAKLAKTPLNKVAAMAHNGYARAICPVHTSADGDSIYALSLGDVPANLDVVGTLAAEVMARAIENAVLSAENAYGLPSAMSFINS